MAWLAGVAAAAGAWGGVGAGEALGQVFTPVTVDPAMSGDCKAIADIGLDGRGDLVVGGSSLVWYESAAGYAKRVIRAGPVYVEFTTDVQAGDIDGDGDLDLVIGDGSVPDNVLWFENPVINAKGPAGDPRVGANWAWHVVGMHGEATHDIELADMDGDGRLDVVTSGLFRTHIWRQVAPNQWVDVDLSQQAGSGAFLGDVDRDGRIDIATPRGWLRNPGGALTGAWAFYPVSGTEGDECLLADLNGDGRLDLVTCDAHHRRPVYWFEQPASATSGAWTRRVVDAAMGSHKIESADFDGDGRRDLLLGLEAEELAVYLNRGAAGFEKVVLDLCCGHNARAGDVDGDGAPDVLGVGWLGHPPVRVYINASPGGSCRANCDGSTEPPVLNVADFSCFLSRYAAGEAWANCDGSTQAPVLNVQDFSCFLGEFAGGCP